ncbi:MAG TPA: type II secretion system F family protein [Candidatus Thermoplasmatota archaeon]|nr:type II secretion system F family protein [Candidatus Thermoplasmatota archaeon]
MAHVAETQSRLLWGPLLTIAVCLAGFLVAQTAPGQGLLTAYVAALLGATLVWILAAASVPGAGAAREAPVRAGTIAAGFLCTALLVAALAVETLAALHRFGHLDLSGIAEGLVPQLSAAAAAGLLAANLGLVVALAYPLPRRGLGAKAAAGAFVAVSLFGLLLAAAISLGLLTELAGRFVGPQEAVFGLNLAAAGALCAVLLATGLPTPLSPPARLALSAAVLQPVLLAVVVVFGVVAVLASAGLAAAASRVLPPLLGFVLLFVVAATLAAAVRPREKPPPPLWVVRMEPERRRRLALLAGGVGASIGIALLAALVGAGLVSEIPSSRWLDLALAAPLVALAPVALHDHLQERKRIRLEDRVPDLLRDLAASRKSGLTLPKATLAAASADYDALSPEVRKMADQVSWGVPFEAALDRMADRVGTVGIRAVAAVVQEASTSGGPVHDVLQVVSEQRREARELEAERRRAMSLYIAIVYVAFGVFLAILLVLNATLLPALAGAGQEAVAAGAGASGLSFGQVDLAAFRTLFLVAAWVQGVGDGVVAGVMSTGRVGTGLKHAVVMGFVALACFGLLVPPP